MSEWSDEAVSTAIDAWRRTTGNDRACMRSALTAADEVRKRETESHAQVLADLHEHDERLSERLGNVERRCLKLEGRDGKLTGEVWRLSDLVSALTARLTALEAGRAAETPKPATERRCGTCRWWSRYPTMPVRIGQCHNVSIRAASQASPWPAEDYGTDCPTWEARHD